EAEEKRMTELNAELQSLREIQKNQAHPLNLVAVKKPGAPVLAKPAEGSRILFNAAAEDEFEFIDAEREWIHVQISGPSRGYIRRNNLELSEFVAARLSPEGAAVPVENPASTLAVEGVVVIFDSADGGIAGVTLATLKQLTAGALSLEDFWKECYRDPPDAFQESRKP